MWESGLSGSMRSLEASHAAVHLQPPEHLLFLAAYF
jgi:hypothetical protein